MSKQRQDSDPADELLQSEQGLAPGALSSGDDRKGVTKSSGDDRRGVKSSGDDR